MEKGYTRVSTPKQAKEGESIATQEYELKQIGFKEFYEADKGKSAYVTAEKIDFEITNKYFIAKFRIDGRPSFKQALFDAKNKKLKKLGIWKWDRFARDLAFQELCFRFFKIMGVQVIPARDTQDPLGRKITGMMSEQESQKTSERIRANYEFKFKHGLPVTNHRKRGYKWSKKPVMIDGKPYKQLIIYEKEKQMILDIFSDLDYKIVLQKYKLHPQTYYNIRKDPFYCGMVEFEGKLKKGIHKPLITLERWKKYQS